MGYVIGQIPSNLLLTRVSPRWVIPSLEVGWGVATICTSSVKSYKALYGLRFLVGLFEYVTLRYSPEDYLFNLGDSIIIPQSLTSPTDLASTRVSTICWDRGTRPEKSASDP